MFYFCSNKFILGNARVSSMSERRETVAPPPAGSGQHSPLPLLSSLPSSTIRQHRIVATSNHRTHEATPRAAVSSLSFLQSLSIHEWIRCPIWPRIQNRCRAPRAAEFLRRKPQFGSQKSSKDLFSNGHCSIV